jgi:hypothetical protein
MITIAQRKKLKKAFKNGYSKEVMLILEDRKIVNKNGNPFSESYVRHVFNGRNSNDLIEEVLFELYQKRVYEVSNKRMIRQQILENKKPEATTPGSF